MATKDIGENRETTLTTKDGKGQKHKSTAGVESGLSHAEQFDTAKPDSLGLSNDPASGRPQKPPRDTVSEPGRAGTFKNR